MACQLYLIFPVVLSLVSAAPPVAYLGCFDLEYGINQGMQTHMINVSLTKCANLCRRRGTTQMGIDKRENFCFCGNDIADESIKRSDDLCQVSCGLSNNFTCGGDWFMSVYRFTTTTITTSTEAAYTDTGSNSYTGFLLGLNDGVRLYRSNSLDKYDTIMFSNRIVFHIDYHYAKGWAYQNTLEGFNRSSLNGKRTHEADSGKQISTRNGCGGFAVDWVEDKIYFAEISNSAIDILTMNLDGSNATKVMTRPGYVATIYKMEIDPYRKILFWISDSVIETCKLLHNDFNTNLSAPGVIARTFSVDMEARRVFYIGLTETSSLYSVDYEGGERTVHYFASQMSDVFGFGVFGDTVYWVNYGRMNHIIYKGPKQITANPNITFLTTIERGVWDMKLVHPDLQKIPKNDPCPKGFEFLEDRKTCSEIKTSSTSIRTERTTFTTSQSTQSQDEIQVQTLDKATEKDAVPENVSEMFSTSHWITVGRSNSNLALDLSKIKFSPSKEVQVKTPSFTTNVVLLSLLSLLIVIIVLASLAYLRTRHWNTLKMKLLGVSYQRDGENGSVTSLHNVGTTGLI